MLGAIFGDIAGSAYEFHNTHDYDFKLLSRRSAPTDDSYMTLAVAKALTETFGQDDDSIRAALVKEMRAFGARYPDAGYGGMFRRWLQAEQPQPYHSFGNGSAMRVSPAGWLYRTLEETLHAARLTAEVTHNHPEGIKGAQAIAAGIFLARAGADKTQIINCIADRFQYNLFRTLDRIRPTYGFYETCQKSVPEAIIAFYEGTDFEDVIRKAVCLGGDSDTIACMAGAIAEAYYGMPDEFREAALSRLDQPMRNLAHAFRSFCREHAGKPENGWQEEIAPKREDPFLKNNPALEARIGEFYADTGSEDRLSAVFQALMVCMSRDGHVLVPTETPENAARVFDPETLRPGDELVLQEDLHFTLIPASNADGTVFMPVFTSEAAMRQSGLEGCSVLSMFLGQYMQQVLGMANAEGLVINPGGRAFLLRKDALGMLLREAGRVKTVQRTPGRDAVFMAPEDVPDGFCDVIAMFAENSLDEADRIWFTGLKDADEKSWLFAVETAAEDPRPVFERMQTMMDQLPGVSAKIDYMKTGGKPWEGAQLIYERQK